MLLLDQLLLLIRWPLLATDPGGGLRSPTLMDCYKSLKACNKW